MMIKKEWKTVIKVIIQAVLTPMVQKSFAKEIIEEEIGRKDLEKCAMWKVDLIQQSKVCHPLQIF